MSWTSCLVWAGQCQKNPFPHSYWLHHRDTIVDVGNDITYLGRKGVFDIRIFFLENGMTSVVDGIELFKLTPPLAVLRNLLLLSISEEFTTFQHIRPGVGLGVGWDVNVHLHLHTTWRLRCCYVGHGLGWGGTLTFICTCTPRGGCVAARVGWDVNVHVYVHTRGCYVAATWGMGWGGCVGVGSCK